MTKQEFTEEIVNILETEADVIEAGVKTLTKNNNTKIDCVSLRAKASGKYTAVVNVDDLYDDFTSGTDISTIVESLIRQCNEQMPKSNFDINNYANVRPNLFVALVNAELNENEKDALADPFLDLLKIVKIIVPSGKNSGLVTVKKSMLDVWGVTATEVFMDAISAKNPYTVTVNDTISNMIGVNDDAPFEFVTNKMKFFGASAILYDDKAVLKKLAKKYHDDLVIIPSSVHEVLVLPYDSGTNVDDLKATIKHVNNSVVEKADILSYSAYKYDRSKNSIEIA
jgi:hypothetical protein